MSTPLKWSEVRRRLDPGKFTIRTVTGRVEKVGDVWGPVMAERIGLAERVGRLDGDL